MEIDTRDWEHVGRTSNATMYAIDETLLAVVPDDRCTDTEATARESLAFQDAHWRERGHRGAAVVFMDPILRQESAARNVYANETGTCLSTCFALVGGTYFGRAVAAVFTGLARPKIPTRFFADLDSARPWIEAQNASRGGPLPPDGPSPS